MELPVNQLRRVGPAEMVVGDADKSTVMEVLMKMAKADVSAVPVLNREGKVVDTFSMSDLAGIRKSTLDLLNEPILNFLHTRKNRPPFDITCRPNTKIGMALEFIVAYSVNRLWVTDVDQRLLTVISISDVISAIDRELVAS